MNQENLDQKLGEYFKMRQRQDWTKKTGDCPEEAKLADYLLNRLSGEEKETLTLHIAHCTYCLNLLDAAYTGNKIFDQLKEKPSPAAIKKAKDVAIAKSVRKDGKIKKFIYPLSAGVAFLLSFLFPKHFLQFLFLALILGLKWVLETGSTRTLIMIYQAWRKPDSQEARKIAEDLKARFNIKR